MAPPDPFENTLKIAGPRRPGRGPSGPTGVPERPGLLRATPRERRRTGDDGHHAAAPTPPRHPASTRGGRHAHRRDPRHGPPPLVPPGPVPGRPPWTARHPAP